VCTRPQFLCLQFALCLIGSFADLLLYQRRRRATGNRGREADAWWWFSAEANKDKSVIFSCKLRCNLVESWEMPRGMNCPKISNSTPS